MNDDDRKKVVHERLDDLFGDVEDIDAAVLLVRTHEGGIRVYHGVRGPASIPALQELVMRAATAVRGFQAKIGEFFTTFPKERKH